MKLLEGKTALITGGSRGIGKAIALKYASEGCRIAFTCTKINDAVQQLVEAIIAQCRAAGCTENTVCKVYCADAADFTVAEQTVKSVIEEFGRIDILVNNAGIAQDSLMLRMSENQWDDVIGVNLKGAFNYIHACLPAMAKQRSGSIISMSSVVGIGGNAGQANYAASKAGLIGMSKSMAKEMGARGIRFNCIAPGLIKTDMSEGIKDEALQEYLKSIPLKRIGTPEDVANTALFLGSDMSSYITGQVIRCCGGLGC